MVGEGGLEVTAAAPKGDSSPTSPGISAFLKNAWANQPVLVVSFSIWGLGECSRSKCASSTLRTSAFHSSSCSPLALPFRHYRSLRSSAPYTHLQDSLTCTLTSKCRKACLRQISQQASLVKNLPWDRAVHSSDALEPWGMGVTC